MWGSSKGKRLQAAEEALERLERRFKGLEDEWVDYYDRIRKTMSRIVKSRAIMEAKETQEEGGAPVTIGDSHSPRSAFLTNRQLEINQQILKRRAGG